MLYEVITVHAHLKRQPCAGQVLVDDRVHPAKAPSLADVILADNGLIDFTA